MSVATDTNAIKSAIDKGTVLPAKTYQIASRIVVPPGKGLLGIDEISVNIVAATNASPETGISISENILYSQIPRRPKIGGFTLNGRGIATNMLYIGFGTLEKFDGINVTGCTGIGTIINELQNSIFLNFHSYGNEQGNLLIDNMSRTIGFDNCKFSYSNGFGVRIQQSNTGINTANGGTTKLIRLNQALIESGDAWSMENGLEILGGTDISIYSINTSLCGVVIDGADRVSFFSGEISNPGGSCLKIVGNVEYQFNACVNLRDGSIYIDPKAQSLNGFAVGAGAQIVTSI